jgi:DNA invertase Pin-like site-specific DNA recombinase
MGVFAEFERSMIAERVPAGLARARRKQLGRPNIEPELEAKVKAPLAKPNRPGVRVIAQQFGISPGTVQRISRPLKPGASNAVAPVPQSDADYARR